MNRTRSTFLVLLLTLSIVIAGCGSSAPQAAPTQGSQAEAETPEGDSTQSEPGTTPEGDSAPVKIKVFAQQGVGYDLETNAFSNEMEQKFNLDFDWQTTTWDAVAAKEARQISLASGDYPDLYLLIPWVDQFTQVELLRYGKQGVILPLNDLIEQHAPNIQAAFEKYPWYKAMETAPDGNIYGINQLIECFHCSHGLQMWVNTKWMEKLNLETPTTPEEFKEVLKAFKTQDPNGNGKQDEIPLSGSAQFLGTVPYPYLLMPYIYYPIADNVMEVPLIVNDGKVDTSANKDATKEGLKYVASLYAEGLIDPGAFTQNVEALQKLGNNAEAEILGAVPTSHPRVFTSDPDYLKDYDPIPPLIGPDGQQNAFYGVSTSAGATFVLTHKASPEAQVAAIKLLDYLFSIEGQLHGYWGEEGVDWRRPQPGDVAVNPEVEPIFAEIPPKEGEEPRNSSWRPLAQYYQPREVRDGWIVGEDIYDPANYARRLQEAAELYEGKHPEEIFPFWAVWLDPEVADETAMLHTNIGDYIQQNTLQFITGAKDIDAEWEAYVAGMEQLGLPRYLEIMQQAYDNYLASQK